MVRKGPPGTKQIRANGCQVDSNQCSDRLLTDAVPRSLLALIVKLKIPGRRYTSYSSYLFFLATTTIRGEQSLAGANVDASCIPRIVNPAVNNASPTSLGE